jgi:hypothetical protein
MKDGETVVKDGLRTRRRHEPTKHHKGYMYMRQKGGERRRRGGRRRRRRVEERE